MASNNNNQPITVGILKESLKNLATRDELKSALKKNNAELREEIKKDTLHLLGEFTEEVLLPAVEEIVDQKVGEKVNGAIGSLRTELKEHIDRRTNETKGDIIAVIKGDRDRDKVFKTKVVEIFDRNKLARSDELVVLSELAR